MGTEIDDTGKDYNSENSKGSNECSQREHAGIYTLAADAMAVAIQLSAKVFAVIVRQLFECRRTLNR